MITVNSLSGGKTSSYMAVQYPADLEIFSLVCLDDHNSNRGSKSFDVTDPKIRQMVNDKLQKYCSHQPEFWATAEDPLTIKTMFDLEQHLGREIIWLRGEGFNQINTQKKLLPNKQHRYCTHLFKIQPIFEFLFMYHSLPCTMRIGFRFDEEKRAESFKDTYEYATHCEVAYDFCGDHVPGNMVTEHLSYSYKNGDQRYKYKRNISTPHRHRWLTVPFRTGEFPLINDFTTQFDVLKYWSEHPEVEFPENSNCQFCFWKHPLTIRDNYNRNPNIIKNAMVMESMIGGTFHAQLSMQQIAILTEQQDLFRMRGGGCDGGYCTG